MIRKKYKLPPEKIQTLIASKIGCIASDMITVYGYQVKYMYREKPDGDKDSGWRFFSGKEDQEYTDNASNFAYYKINTIVNYDLAICDYLDEPVGSSFERIEGTDRFRLLNQ